MLMEHLPTTISHPDLETRLQPTACSHLRTWFRLLSCTKLLENEIRSRLRKEFNTTLPRYDMLSHLEKHPEGILMGDLSRHLLVTNGNITGIADQLIKEGMVQRIKPLEDRRRSLLKLTAKGKKTVTTIHTAHHDWICSVFGKLSDTDIQHFLKNLNLLKTHSLSFTDSHPSAQ